MSDSIRLDVQARAVASTVFSEVVTLVIKHRIKAGQESAYEAWLRRIVTIASGYPGHLGVDVIRSQSAGLQLFTCVLRFHSTDAMQHWLDSSERRQLVQEAEPMLADGDQTQVNPHNEFWFTPPSDDVTPPPRWKQACVTFLVILPLSLLIPLLWKPVLALSPWLSGYLVSNALVTATIVLLVVYLLMPAATRLFAPWLKATIKEPQGK
ncbi:antibiotic biosynthesis monooxygenase [Pseudomonas sp. NPDC089734]|uniref:antibiotic biosynthesis monooxygenase n=1 Tax=Pseudomonas sp. NPDC089734 TaxID=3364469 RepID=UPI003812C390